MTFYSPDSDGMVAIPTALIPAQQEVINDAVMPLLFAGQPYKTVAVVLCSRPRCRGDNLRRRLIIPDQGPGGISVYQGTMRTTDPDRLTNAKRARKRQRVSMADMYLVAIGHQPTKELLRPQLQLPSWCDDHGEGSIPLEKLLIALREFGDAGKVQKIGVAHRH